MENQAKISHDIENFSAYWTSPKIVLKCVGPKLVPFFKTAAIYFVLASPFPSWFACLIKSLPIVCLCGFVLVHGMSLSDKHAYARRILLGLIFCCIGDIMLIWPCCFLWGMMSFMIGHLLYISAFGMKPLNPIAGFVCATVGVVGIYFIEQGCYGAYTVFIPVYTFLLMFMVWRAVARVQLFEDLWTWTKLCSCGGGMLFAVSDLLLGLNKFRTSVPYAATIIMLTYYAAQLGIALSVVDSASMAIISAAHTKDSSSCCHSHLRNKVSSSDTSLRTRNKKSDSLIKKEDDDISCNKCE